MILPLSAIPVLAGRTLTALWTPAVTGLQVARFDANTGITLNGSTVSAWADADGGGTTLVQGTTAQQPTFSANDGAGYKNINFDGGVYKYLNAALTFNNATGAIYCLATEASTVSSGGRLALMSTAAADNSQSLRINRVSTNQSICAATAVTQTAGNPIVYDTKTIMGARYDGISIISDANTVEKTVVIATGGFALTRLTAGTGTTATNTFSNVNYWQGRLYEMIVFSADLATGPRQQLQGYLSWKWVGDGSLLPFGHPYKTIPPRV